MMAQKTAPSRLEGEPLSERPLLEFRGNYDLELPLLWFANLNATSAHDAVEVASVISPRNFRSAPRTIDVQCDHLSKE